MNSVRKLALLAGALALALLAPIAPAAAGVGVNVDVLWSPNPDDDSQVFLHVSNMNWPAPRERVAAVFHEIPDPYNDYPVLAFIAYHGRIDLGTVWSYRRKGHNWYNCMMHFGVGPDVLFVNLPEHPSPPYGKAYGYWRKHGRRLTPDHVKDVDVRYWVNLRSVSMYAGVTPVKAWEWRESGRRFPVIAANHYRQKHGKGRGPQEAGFGNGKGSGKGHGKPKEKDRD